MTIVYYLLDHSKCNAQLFIYHFTHSINGFVLYLYIFTAIILFCSAKV